MTALVAVAVRLYAAALKLLPRELHERHHDDMRQTFEDRAAGCGRLALVTLLFHELVDLGMSRARPNPSV